MTTVTATVNGVTMTLDQVGTSTTYQKQGIASPNETSGMNHTDAEHPTGGLGPGVGTLARGKGYYPITVTATSASPLPSVSVDDTTPGAIGLACRLKVKELTAPIVGTTYPAEGDYINPSAAPITWVITDQGSGPTETTTLTLDGTPLTDVSTSTSLDLTTVSCSKLFPSDISSGAHTLTFQGVDYDGNYSTVKTVHFIANKYAPDLQVSSPQDQIWLAVNQVLVAGTVTAEYIGEKFTVEISLNGTVVQTFTDHVGDFSYTITNLEDTKAGHIIKVKATDTGGTSAEITRTIYVDTVPPEIVSVDVSPNPTDPEHPYTITVVVND